MHSKLTTILFIVCDILLCDAGKLQWEDRYRFKNIVIPDHKFSDNWSQVSDNWSQV